MHAERTAGTEPRERSDTLTTVASAPTLLARPSFAEVIERLQEAYPKAFSTPPKPLKIGIHKLIRAAKPASLEGFANATISKGIGRWVRRDAYLEALRNREPRHDLDGRPVSDVSDEAVESATHALRRRRKRQAAEAREQAAKIPTGTVHPSESRPHAPRGGRTCRYARDDRRPDLNPRRPAPGDRQNRSIAPDDRFRSRDLTSSAIESQ